MGDPNYVTGEKVTMFIQCRKYIGRITAILWLLLFFCLVLAEYASARVLPPVHVKIKTDWVAKKGRPLIHVAKKGEVINVNIVISSNIDLDAADFELLLPEGWEFVGGERNWKGALKKGGEIILKATLRATSSNFGVIKGRVYLPGASVEGLLDLRDPETTDRIPEMGVGSKVPTDVPTIFQDDVIPQLPELKQLRPEPTVTPANRELEQIRLDPKDKEDPKGDL